MGRTARAVPARQKWSQVTQTGWRYVGNSINDTADSAYNHTSYCTLIGRDWNSAGQYGYNFVKVPVGAQIPDLANQFGSAWHDSVSAVNIRGCL